MSTPIPRNRDPQSDRSDSPEPSLKDARDSALQKLEAEILSRASRLKWSPGGEPGEYIAEFNGMELVSRNSAGTNFQQARLKHFDGFSADFCRDLALIAETKWFHQMSGGNR